MEEIFGAFLYIFNITALRYLFIAGLPFLIFYFLCRSYFLQSKIQEKSATRRDFWREIGHSLGTTVIFSVIALLILETPLKSFTLIYDDLNEFPTWYIPLSVALSLIVHDTYFYWMHRIMHHPSVYKKVHLLHHKSVNPSPWTSYSFHIVEAVFEGAVLFVLALILPLHPLSIGLFTLSSFIINVYGHLGYEIAPLWFRKTIFFQIFNTSVHHNLHHSKFNGNYGLYFRFWDRIMGTENPEYVSAYDKIQQARSEKVSVNNESNSRLA